MNLKRVLLIAGSWLLFFSVMAPAYAANGVLSATHRLVSAAPYEQGIEVIFDVIIKNTSESNFSEVSLSLLDSPLFQSLGVKSFQVDALKAGEQVVMTWSVQTHNSPEIFIDDTLLQLYANVRDQFGQPVHFSIDSEAVSVP